jgi:hypothetical protein
VRLALLIFRAKSDPPNEVAAELARTDRVRFKASAANLRH